MGYVFKAMLVYQRIPFGGKSGLRGIAKKEGLNDDYSGVFEFVRISIYELNAYMYIESSSNMGIMSIQPMMIIHCSLVKIGLDEKVCRELVPIS